MTTNTIPAKLEGRWNRVATRCCVCGTSLKDATSIEFGIGPVCRRKYNYEDAYPINPNVGADITVFLAEQKFPYEVFSRVNEAVERDDSRRAANLLVYYASAEQGHAAVLAAHALGMLGYTALAERISQRLLKVHLTRTADGAVAIKTPYSQVFVATLKARYIEGRRWDGAEKVWIMPDSPEAADMTFNALLSAFSGEWAVGPKGPFEIK
jgi:hypothetical protein